MTWSQMLAEAANDPTLLRWYVVEVDETGYWMFEKLEKDMLRDLDRFDDQWIPKVKARYLASPDVGVHICSAERMAEAWYVESSPVWDRNDVPDYVVEYVSDWIRDGDASEPVSYFDHARFFEKVRGVSGPGFKFVGATRVEDGGAERDDLIEYERCNPSF